MHQLTPIDEEMQEYERAVTRAGKESAERHVADVLAVLECALRHVRKQIDCGHDGKVTRSAPVDQGRQLLTFVLETLPEAIEIDYQDVVAEADDEDLLLSRDEYVADAVRDHVDQLFVDLLKRVTENMPTAPMRQYPPGMF